MGKKKGSSTIHNGEGDSTAFGSVFLTSSTTSIEYDKACGVCIVGEPFLGATSVPFLGHF